MRRPRLARLSFTIISAISLLLCIASSLLWVRSYWVQDQLKSRSVSDNHEVETHAEAGWGQLHVERITHLPAYFWPIGGQRPYARQPASIHHRTWPLEAQPQRPIATTVWERFGLFIHHDVDPAPPQVPPESETLFILLPLWMPSLIFAVLPIAWFVVARPARVRRRSGFCVHCGYDLRASPERCPECGAEHDLGHAVFDERADELSRKSEQWKRRAFMAAGWAFVCLAALGVFLPLLPTTPFVLLASSCFVRSSPRAQRWLQNNRWFGPALRDWNEHRAVRRPIKVLALVTCSAVMALTFVREMHWGLRIAILGVGAVGFLVVLRLPVIRHRTPNVNQI